MYIDCGAFGGECACGHRHNVRTKAAIIEPGCLTRLDAWLRTFGVLGRRCTLYDENTYDATVGRHPAAGQELVLPGGDLHADERSTTWVLERMADDTEVILAVGSGTVNDIARFCAYRRGIRFVSIPTAASVDGFCSTVCAMTWQGFKTSSTAAAPELVVADLDVIRAAPPALMRSGVGDILAKFTALADWEIAHTLSGEHFCPRIHRIMQTAADTVLAQIPALPSGSEEAYGQLVRALALSGLAMQMMENSRPASGAEHHISHLIEMGPAGLSVRFPALHGEKTGVGALLAARAYRQVTESEAPPRLDFRRVPDEEEIRRFFGPRLSEAILKENRADCLAGVTQPRLEAAWPEIRRIVSQIPPADRLEEALVSLGAKHTPEEIGVSAGDTETLLRYSPLVRPRLTLMRLRQVLAR